jgi:hypothetical protein
MVRVAHVISLYLLLACLFAVAPLHAGRSPQGVTGIAVDNALWRPFIEWAKAQ